MGSVPLGHAPRGCEQVSEAPFRQPTELDVFATEGTLVPMFTQALEARANPLQLHLLQVPLETENNNQLTNSIMTNWFELL